MKTWQLGLTLVGAGVLGVGVCGGVPWLLNAKSTLLNAVGVVVLGAIALGIILGLWETLVVRDRGPEVVEKDPNEKVH